MLVFVRLLIVGRMIMGMGAVVASVLMVVPVLVRPVFVGMRMGMIMLMAVCVAVLMLVRFAAVAVRVGVKMLVIMGMYMGMFVSSLHG
jgi:hypothetical protein